LKLYGVNGLNGVKAKALLRFDAIGLDQAAPFCYFGTQMI
jgi:hypothetical protein